MNRKQIKSYFRKVERLKKKWLSFFWVAWQVYYDLRKNVIEIKQKAYWERSNVRAWRIFWLFIGIREAVNILWEFRLIAIFCFFHILSPSCRIRSQRASVSPWPMSLAVSSRSLRCPDDQSGTPLVFRVELFVFLSRRGKINGFPLWSVKLHRWLMVSISCLSLGNALPQLRQWDLKEHTLIPQTTFKRFHSSQFLFTLQGTCLRIEISKQTYKSNRNVLK